MIYLKSAAKVKNYQKNSCFVDFSFDKPHFEKENADEVTKNEYK